MQRFNDSSAKSSLALELPAEAAISISFNHETYALILASPADLTNLALGFAFSEGIIHAFDDVDNVSILPTQSGFQVDLSVGVVESKRAASLKRHVMATSSCGLCGVNSDADLLNGLSRLPYSPLPNVGFLLSAIEQLQARNQRAMHSALWVDLNGKRSSIASDIGRHNALDKLIGSSLSQQQTMADGSFGIVISSRCSLELVQKCVRRKVAYLATLSYPSKMAVDVARACNLTLINCHRGNQLELLSRSE